MWMVIDHTPHQMHWLLFETLSATYYNLHTPTYMSTACEILHLVTRQSVMSLLCYSTAWWDLSLKSQNLWNTAQYGNDFVSKFNNTSIFYVHFERYFCWYLLKLLICWFSGISHIQCVCCSECWKAVYILWPIYFAEQPVHFNRSKKR